jgi:competence protein ComEA
MYFRIARIPILAILSLLPALAARATDAPDAAGGKKININQASATQFALLPRVGAKQAERIVEYRKAHGQFAQIEELMEVKGVGEKLFSQVKPYVALSGPTTLSAKVSSKGTRGGPKAKKAGTKSASGSSSASAGSGR